MAGHFVGYRMASGTITVMDGCGDDAGAEMTGGHLFVRGAAGARIGGGMEDGLIVVHGDVGPDLGAGMKGGRIVVNGRCPSPPPGVLLRPLTKKELGDINSILEDESMHVPSMPSVSHLKRGSTLRAPVFRCRATTSPASG